MKTQIKDLINGSPRTWRDNDNPKYENAKHDSNYRILGTPYAERLEIGKKVAEENTDLTLIVKGEKIIAKKSVSRSGLSWSWEGQISRELYRSFGGPANLHDDMETYYLRVNMDMTIDCFKQKGRSPKTNGYITIDESFIEIL